MQTVHIYAEAGRVAQKTMRRKTCYLLEYARDPERTVTRGKILKKDATYNAAIIQTLIEALGRLTRHCEVHIHAQNQYILTMINEMLPEWEKNGFQTARGKPIANQGEWMQLEMEMKANECAFDWKLPL